MSPLSKNWKVKMQVVIDGKPRVITQGEDMYLRCAVHPDAVCYCVDELIQSGLDAEGLWIEDLRWDMDALLPVKVLPNKYCWGYVRMVEEGEGPTRYRKVYLVIKDAPAIPDQEEFLGLTSEGEGRAAIRDMLLNWLYPLMSKPDFRCLSSNHSFKSEMKWVKDTAGSTNNRERLAQSWSVATTGLCLGCAASDSASFDDLVPDAGASSSIWNKP